MRVVDTDGHVWAPENLWTARMDAARWGDWIPRRVVEEDCDVVSTGGEVRGVRILHARVDRATRRRRACSSHFAFGGEDAYVVVDLPDNEAAAALAMTASASGLVGVRTVVLLTPAEVDDAVKRRVSYRPPGR